jgi:hypothetical protein
MLVVMRHNLVRCTVVLLLAVSLSGFLPANARAQHLIHLSNHSTGEEGPPVKAEQLETSADVAIVKRVRALRQRAKARWLLSTPSMALALPTLANQDSNFACWFLARSPLVSPLRC